MTLLSLVVMSAVWILGLVTLWQIDHGLCLVTLLLIAAGAIWGGHE